MLRSMESGAGAAIGAGIGCNEFSISNAFENLSPIKRVEVTDAMTYNELYEKWEEKLETELANMNQKIEA